MAHLDHEVGDLVVAAGVVHAAGPVGERGDGLDPAAPAHGVVGKRAQEQATKLAAIDLGSGLVARVGSLAPHDCGGDRIERAHLLTLRPGQGVELVEQACRAQRALAGVGMHVEGAALRVGVGGRLAFDDGDGAAVQLQHAGAGQAAEAGADDHDAEVRCGVHATRQSTTTLQVQ